MIMLSRIRAALSSPDGLKRLKDYLYAAVLWNTPPGIRRGLFAGRNYYCPICDSGINRFMVIHRAHHLWCPVCSSLQRHRLLWLLFEKEGWLDIPLGNQLQLLHFAPELCLERILRQTPGVNYLSADLHNHRAMIKADISALQFNDDSFDLIICSHVLEHVPDDHKAIGELRRILNPGGKAIILVPIEGDNTDEDLSITDPVEREQRFGQLDHVRSYGKDFTKRLEKVGFSVQTKDVTSLGINNHDIKRFGLEANDIVFICMK